jgi:hypothetical protein
MMKKLNASSNLNWLKVSLGWLWEVCCGGELWLFGKLAVLE